MQTLLPVAHQLLESVEHMLSPEAFSCLVQSPIRQIRRAPFAERMGTSNNNFEWITTMADTGDEQHYVLKRINFNNEWFMIVSHDVLCRSVTLWQYGLLNRLSSHLDSAILACSHDDEGRAILMKDVSVGQHPPASDVATLTQIHSFLDALAFMHATFWEDDDLKCAQLGLNDNVNLMAMTSVPTVRKYAHIPSVIPGFILEGWEIIQTLLDPDTLEIYRSLMLNPQPLNDALARYPETLTHCDYRPGDNANLSYMAAQQVPMCVLDWQFASCTLMSIDFGWFINRVNVRSVITPHPAAAYYQKRLEHYLGFRFDPIQWQAMLELGLLASSLRTACFDAYFMRHEEYGAHRALIDEYNDQIRAGARWL